MIPNKSQLPIACSASLQPWFPQSPFHRHCCSFIAQPHPQPVAAAWASSMHPSPTSRTLPCRYRHCRFASSCCYEASHTAAQSCVIAAGSRGSLSSSCSKELELAMPLYKKMAWRVLTGAPCCQALMAGNLKWRLREKTRDKRDDRESRRGKGIGFYFGSVFLLVWFEACVENKTRYFQECHRVFDCS